MEMSHDSRPWETLHSTIKVDVARRVRQSGKDFGAKVSQWSFAHWRYLHLFPRFTAFWRCRPKVRHVDIIDRQFEQWFNFNYPALCLFFPPLCWFRVSVTMVYLLAGACLLQVDEGPCKGEIERYYYNTITQKCEVFYYGGCQGNANNFNSYQECQKTCFRIPSKFSTCLACTFKVLVTFPISESYWMCTGCVLLLYFILKW